MTATCPAGHSSTADDYCDVCGMPIEASAGAQPASLEAPAAPAATSAAPGQPCPHCGTENPAEALFCEACGYDFTTGSMPRSTPAPAAGPAQPDVAGQSGAEGSQPALSTSSGAPTQAPVRWVAEIWIDPAWYEAQDSPDPLPSPGPPEVVPLRLTSVLVGRTSRSRNIHPEVDCGTDSGVSRRQAQLTSDGTRWFVEDLESANGTFVGPASGALPTDPIPVGTKVQLDPDDRVYVGGWTRLVIREATEDEVLAFD